MRRVLSEVWIAMRADDRDWCMVVDGSRQEASACAARMSAISIGGQKWRAVKFVRATSKRKAKP